MVSESKTAASVIAAASQSNPRVIPGRESFSAEKRIGKHAKFGEHVPSPTSSTPFAMEPSQLDLAKLGCFWKWKLLRAGLQVRMREVEKSLLHDIFERDIWLSFEGDEVVQHKGHPGAGEKASLLNDAASGGDYLVPQWYDDMLIHSPLLHGELLPYVTIRTVPFGDTYSGGIIGNATITSGLTEGSAATAMDASSLVSQLSGSIFDAGCYLEVGRNLLADVPAVDLGQDLLSELGQSWLAWLEEQISVGDGTTEPAGIFTVGGTNIESSANGTGGPFAISDLERLSFGISLARRRLAGNGARYVTSDYLYRQARQVPVGSDDARRLLGLDHQEYKILGYGVSINDSIPNGSIAFCSLRDYRLYRRPGPVMQIETGGQTLTLKNTVLVYLRGRVGGEPTVGASICKMTDGPTSYGN